MPFLLQLITTTALHSADASLRPVESVRKKLWETTTLFTVSEAEDTYRLMADLSKKDLSGDTMRGLVTDIRQLKGRIVEKDDAWPVLAQLASLQRELEKRLKALPPRLNTGYIG